MHHLAPMAEGWRNANLLFAAAACTAHPLHGFCSQRDFGITRAALKQYNGRHETPDSTTVVRNLQRSSVAARDCSQGARAQSSAKEQPRAYRGYAEASGSCP